MWARRALKHQKRRFPARAVAELEAEVREAECARAAAEAVTKAQEENAATAQEEQVAAAEAVEAAEPTEANAAGREAQPHTEGTDLVTADGSFGLASFDFEDISPPPPGAVRSAQKAAATDTNGDGVLYGFDTDQDGCFDAPTADRVAKIEVVRSGSEETDDGGARADASPLPARQAPRPEPTLAVVPPAVMKLLAQLRGPAPAHVQRAQAAQAAMDAVFEEHKGIIDAALDAANHPSKGIIDAGWGKQSFGRRAQKGDRPRTPAKRGQWPRTPAKRRDSPPRRVDVQKLAVLETAVVTLEKASRKLLEARRRVCGDGAAVGASKPSSRGAARPNTAPAQHAT